MPEPPPRGDAAGFLATRLRLTRDGRALLAGELDRVEATGIDRWVGGTHLRPGDVWRWDTRVRALRAPGAQF